MIDSVQQISEIDEEPSFSIPVFQKKLVSWYFENKRDLPWRVLWLKNKNPYHIWVSEIMLQQTVIKAVLPVYGRFLDKFPEVWDLASASEDEVRSAVRGLGYYRRFKFMHQAAKELTANQSKSKFIWPDQAASWKKLSGIGDYTAAAISSIAFNRPEAVLDGNVERVLCRLFDVRLPANLPALKKRFKVLSQKLVDVKYPGDFNQGMMELGQTVCTPSSPNCKICPIKSHCQALKNSSADKAPGAKIKKAFIDTDVRLIILKKKKNIGILRRPVEAKFLKDYPGFLTAIKTGKSFAYDNIKGPRAFSHLTSLGEFKHTITHHKMRVEVCVAKDEFLESLQQSPLDVTWIKEHDADEQLISNLDRKAWHFYLKKFPL